MKLMMLAGEASGDSHAAALVAELKKIYPGLFCFGMGGPALKAEGARLHYELGSLAVMGLAEVLKKYFHFRRIFKNLERLLDVERPDALILVDFPGFNVRFARVAKKRGVPVIYYVSPQIWAWGRRRRRTIARRVDKMLVLFPFEKGVYEGTGLDVEYVGHPSLDKLAAQEAQSNGARPAGSGPLVGLLPGSRPHEVQRLFPLMAETAAKIRAERPDARFVVSAVNLEARQKIEAAVRDAGFPAEIKTGGAHAIMRKSDLVIVASGTATLECAFFRTPMLITYKVSPLTWWVGRMVVRLPYIGLANVIAGRKIVPEFLQGEARADLISREALGLLGSPQKLREMKEELGRVREALGEPGASRRAARAVAEFLKR